MNELADFHTKFRVLIEDNTFLSRGVEHVGFGDVSSNNECKWLNRIDIITCHNRFSFLNKKKHNLN